MPHGMSHRERTFIGIQNGKGHVETLRHNSTSRIIGIRRYIGAIRQGVGETRDFALHRMFSNPSLQIITVPFDFDIHYTFQDAVDSFNNHRKLNRKKSERRLRISNENLSSTATKLVHYLY